MHPGGTAWEVRPPARVVESGAAGRAVSAMVEEKRGRKGMLTSAIPSLPTGAIQGTLHPPLRLDALPPLDRSSRCSTATPAPRSNDLSAIARGPLQSASNPGNGRRLAL